jgi:hypothetical protein
MLSISSLLPAVSRGGADSLVATFSGAGASAVAVVVAAPFSPFPSEPEVLLAAAVVVVVRVRGVRCDISVLLNAALKFTGTLFLPSILYGIHAARVSI